MTEPRRPWFALPGFFPDAIPYAVRTALAALLAYGFAFAAQVPSASSAGVTVGIIAQPSAGMALSKAYYRVAGTLIGCVVAIVLGALFGQDRTMLLMAFTAWMALCGATATLLRDFRSYGAALSGYTVAIVAINGIDDPDGLLLSAINRTAAVLIGIFAVAILNALLGGSSAYAVLCRGLTTQRDAARQLAIDALEGCGVPDELTLTRQAAAISALQTDATYAAAEQIHGRRRRHGAQVVIGALFTAISASRTVAGTLGPRTAPAVAEALRAHAAALRDGTPPPAAPGLAEPIDALLIERAEAITASLQQAAAGLVVLSGGEAALPPVVLRASTDRAAALINAARVAIAVSLTATFVVLAGWPGATLVLVQQAAFVGLLGTTATPTRNSIAFLLPLFPAAMVVGAIEFLVLPLTSGFLPFSIVVGGLLFATGLLGRHTKLAPYAPATFIYVTLLLAPANPETFDLGSYLNTTLQIGLSTVFTTLSFALILPVSPKRRLFRVVAAVAGELRHTERSPARPLSPSVAQALLYDRLVQALTWLGRPTGTRRRLLSHIYRMGASDIALRRARNGLMDILRTAPAAQNLVAAARRSMDARDLPAMHDTAHALLADPDLPAAPVRQAVSGMADLAFQEGDSHCASRFLALMTG